MVGSHVGIDSGWKLIVGQSEPYSLWVRDEIEQEGSECILATINYTRV